MLNLIYFPFAGGSANSIGTLVKELPRHWNFVALEYPGRGTRWREDLVYDTQALAHDLQSQLLGAINQDWPCVFLGYSFGSMMAFLVASKMQHELNIIGFCSLSAKPASEISPTSNKGHLESDQKLVDYLVSLGGIPEPIRESEELLQWYLPIIKADLMAYSTFKDQLLQIDVPILSITGDKDPIINPALLGAWARSSRLPKLCRHHVIRGDHFCHLGNESHLVELINQWVVDVLSRDEMQIFA